MVNLDKFLNENKSAGNYIFHLDEYVIIYTQSKSIMGKIIFTDYDKTLLCPSLVDESLSEKDRRYRIEDKKPRTINTQTIQDVAPIREDYLTEIVDYYQKEQMKKEKSA